MDVHVNAYFYNKYIRIIRFIRIIRKYILDLLVNILDFIVNILESKLKLRNLIGKAKN